MTTGKPGNKPPTPPVTKPVKPSPGTGQAVLKGEINRSFSVMNTHPAPPPLPPKTGK